ncbi:MAG: mitochondrial K+-H+ exchange-related family protein [Acidobacteria bacterium]|jgi:hypothetical protein|nr:mitochondrial K+-H+ exchange-related family protein [Acidobacteriota bacterium]
MDTITITLSPGGRNQVEISDIPELSSKNRLVNKGIAVLRKYAPGILHYLSKQRLLGHLSLYRVEVRGGAGMSLAEVRALLADWMRRKRTRRLFYVVLELLLMPITAFMALLPGPNVFFYGLFVVFYFHAKALWSLSRIKVEELDISLVQD